LLLDRRAIVVAAKQEHHFAKIVQLLQDESGLKYDRTDVTSAHQANQLHPVGTTIFAKSFGGLQQMMSVWQRNVRVL
jgi:hypothetical protein